LEESLPKLNTLILTNNNIQELADIEKLSSVQSLEMLSLLSNPVCAKPNYRQFVIHKFTNLRVLDFKKVKLQEREDAKKLFKSKQGKEQLKEIVKIAKTFVPGSGAGGLTANGDGSKKNNLAGLTPDQIKNIKSAISKATTLEEIERLNHMLRTGAIPGGGKMNGTNGSKNNEEQIVEMDED
jgi:U2 small nuclear ribonucleoprotein A'